VKEPPVAEGEWVYVIDGLPWAWSPDGKLIYAISDRDGHTCIWAQRLDGMTKRPIGPPFPVFHSHDVRLSLTYMTLSIRGDRMLFSVGERTGNIWMAEWKERQ
jgi:Tol biopolymer transport system component